MTKAIDDFIIPNDGHVLDGLVVGGDISEQSHGNDQLVCCSAAALPEEAAESLPVAIGGAIRDHTGRTLVDAIEVHAKQIWNGSERKTSAFASLESKTQMQTFFIDLAKRINRVCPYIVVAVERTSATHKDGKALSKRVLMNIALGRIDSNLRYLTGRHLGSPHYFLDPENESITNYSRNPSEPGSYFPEARALFSDGRPQLYYSVSPVHHEITSDQNRLIQVADVAAYFVGKYLALYAALKKHFATTPNITEKILHQVSDVNFCLSMWDTLNIEAVFLRTPTQWGDEPDWVGEITAPYASIIRMGPDLCICSLREALPRRRLSGIGYWIARPRGALSIRDDLIPSEV